MNLLTRGDEMLTFSRAFTSGSYLLLFWGVIPVILQACDFHVYHHRDLQTVVRDGRGPVVPAGDDCGAQGCDPKPYSASAAGFVGIGGASPVVSGTCSALGSTKCGNENAAGCSLRYPTKVCKSTFTYATNKCECQCLYP